MPQYSNNTDSAVFFYEGSGKRDTLVVSFAGTATRFGGVPLYEFRNFLTKRFPNTAVLYCTDTSKTWYHNGITGVTDSIESSITYLYDYTKNYRQTIFVGTSAGGYAAILFGSLLGATKVLAFVPQTIISGISHCDVEPLISKETQYLLYGDPLITDNSDLHCIHHCKRLEHNPSVTVIEVEGLDLPGMRDSGVLYSIFYDLLG